MPDAKYLSIHYGPTRSSYFNVHKSSGTMAAKKLHYHDFFQIYFVNEGVLVHHSESDSIELVAGDCFIVPPFFKHYISPGETPPVFYSCSFKEAFLDDNLMQNKYIKELLTMLTPQNTLLKLSLKADKINHIKNLLTYSISEFDEQAVGWECSVKGLLSNILILFYRTYKTGSALTYNSSSSMQDCLTYINIHFKEDLHLEDILKKFHFSHSTFLREFKKATGKSFRSYLKELRIDYACLLLRETSKSISSICNECGYWDYSAFYRSFYSKTKTSPIKYREMSKK